MADEKMESSEAQTTYIYESEDGGQLTDYAKGLIETSSQYLLLPGENDAAGEGSQPDDAVGETSQAEAGQIAGDEFLLSVGLTPSSGIEPMEVGGEGSWELAAVVPSCEGSSGETLPEAGTAILTGQSLGTVTIIASSPSKGGGSPVKGVPTVVASTTTSSVKSSSPAKSASPVKSTSPVKSVALVKATAPVKATAAAPAKSTITVKPSVPATKFSGTAKTYSRSGKAGVAPPVAQKIVIVPPGGVRIGATGQLQKTATMPTLKLTQVVVPGMSTTVTVTDEANEEDRSESPPIITSQFGRGAGGSASTTSVKSTPASAASTTSVKSTPASAKNTPKVFTASEKAKKFDPNEQEDSPDETVTIVKRSHKRMVVPGQAKTLINKQTKALVVVQPKTPVVQTRKRKISESESVEDDDEGDEDDEDEDGDDDDEDEDDSDDLEEGEIRLPKKPTNTKQKITNKKKVESSTTQAKKKKKAEPLVEVSAEVRKSNRRSAMSSKLAAWGLIPQAAGSKKSRVNSSEDDYRSESDDDEVEEPGSKNPVPKKTPVSTYQKKKTPVNSEKKPTPELPNSAVEQIRQTVVAPKMTVAMAKQAIAGKQPTPLAKATLVTKPTIVAPKSTPVGKPAEGSKSDVATEADVETKQEVKDDAKSAAIGVLKQTIITPLNTGTSKAVPKIAMKLSDVPDTPKSAPLLEEGEIVAVVKSASPVASTSQTDIIDSPKPVVASEAGPSSVVKPEPAAVAKPTSSTVAQKALAKATAVAFTPKSSQATTLMKPKAAGTPKVAGVQTDSAGTGPKPPTKPRMKHSGPDTKSGPEYWKTKVVMQSKSLMCKPIMMTKATSCNPIRMSKATQTDEDCSAKGRIFVPVPVPILVPAPMSLYNVPTPVPLPVPVPIPIPCFIPTTRSSIAAVIKQLKELHDSMPSDPFEADMLRMAEAIAVADQEEPDIPVLQPKLEGVILNMPQSAQGGSDMTMDMIEAALRMAEEGEMETDDITGHHVGSLILTGKRTIIDTTDSGVKRARHDLIGQSVANQGVPPGAIARRVPINDSVMKLKYSYGVNAWKLWVAAKNDDLEKTSSKGGSRSTSMKHFKSEILSCSADELNFYLSLFVKDVCKPTGEQYAPDSVFYLCLGIQHYLYENGRIDNIFSDVYYARFIESLNELLMGFHVKLNSHGQIVCRITEEHLWESRQLGAHSPHVLLNTLVYFNTKHFMLMTTDAHSTLSFTSIMKQWKKNADGRPARTVYLRFNAQAVSSQKSTSEAVPYEQLENLDDPFRCPVKLYEFYLSKCPEITRNRNDMFYLLPEPSCVPDSPVWYSGHKLGVDAMSRILNRISVIREIHEAQVNQAPSCYG